MLNQEWNSCDHDWEEMVDSQFSNEKVEAVVCNKCGCHGSRDMLTGFVFWPAT